MIKLLIKIYQFVWHTFCDWYLEFAKPILQGENESQKIETRESTAWTLDIIMRLLHPIMPFITEELWEQFGDGRLLITSSWPDNDCAEINTDATEEMNWVVGLISEFRAVRSELNVPAGAKVSTNLLGLNTENQNSLKNNMAQILRLANLEKAEVILVDSPEVIKKLSQEAIQFVYREATIYINVVGLIDFDKERSRLNKDIGKLDTDIAAIDKKLTNRNFISKAPKKVVEEQHERREIALVAKKKLKFALSRLKTE